LPKRIYETQAYEIKLNNKIISRNMLSGNVVILILILKEIIKWEAVKEEIL